MLIESVDHYSWVGIFLKIDNNSYLALRGLISNILDTLELFLLNKGSLLNEMDRFLEEFKSLRDELATEDTEGMKEKMRISTQRRALFDKPKKKV